MQYEITLVRYTLLIGDRARGGVKSGGPNFQPLTEEDRDEIRPRTL